MPKKRRRSAAQDALLRDIARKLSDHISRNRLQKADAAAELGITKQRLHKYLRAEMVPGADFLCQVAEKWNLEFSYRRHSFGATAFRKDQGALKVGWEQLELFDQPQVLKNDRLEVKVHRRTPKSLDLSIEIRLVS